MPTCSSCGFGIEPNDRHATVTARGDGAIITECEMHREGYETRYVCIAPPPPQRIYFSKIEDHQF